MASNLKDNKMFTRPNRQSAMYTGVLYYLHDYAIKLRLIFIYIYIYLL